MKPSDFKVGQPLVAVYVSRGAQEVRDVVVRAVGRRWVSFSPPENAGRPRARWWDRFDPDDMAIDGGGFSEPGRVYLTREDYARHMRAKAIREAIRKAADYGGGRFADVSLDDLEAVAMLLGLDV